MVTNTSAVSSLVFFGDSLTDPGPAPSPERPVVGPNYSQYLPAELGVSAKNYAVGGAQAFSAGDSEAQSSINLDAQVARYLAEVGNAGVPAGTAVSIYMGGNDYSVLTSPEEAAAVIGGVMASTNAAITALAGVGVRDVILYTQFNVSSLPLGNLLPPEFVQAADAVMAAHNAGLRQVADMQRAAGLNVMIVDSNRLLVEIESDMETFGIKEYNTPQYLPDEQGNYQPSPARGIYDPSEIAFFDFSHLATVTHEVLAAFSEATLKAGKVDLLGDASDRLEGSALQDLIFGGGGADVLRGYLSNDVIFAGAGNDKVEGGKNDDLLSGGGGNDRLNGDGGADFLAGNAGTDTLLGGDGNDIFVDGSGGDSVTGGNGDDLFFFADDGLGNGKDIIDGGNNLDVVRVAVSAELYQSQAFETQLQSFVSHYNSSCGFSNFTFASLDLTLRGIDRIEIFVDDQQVYAAGRAAPVMSVKAQAMLHDAGLWGLI